MSAAQQPIKVYICEGCGANCGPSENWTEKDAQIEKIAHFGNIPDEDCGVLCDECDAKFMLWYRDNILDGKTRTN